LEGINQRCSETEAMGPNPACGTPDHPEKFRARESALRFHFAALRHRGQTPPGHTVQTRDWWWRTGSGLQKIGFALGSGAAQDTFPRTKPPWRDVSWTRKPGRNHSFFLSRVPFHLPAMRTDRILRSSPRRASLRWQEHGDPICGITMAFGPKVVKRVRYSCNDLAAGAAVNRKKLRP
jgi:hypothetical protein